MKGYETLHYPFIYYHLPLKNHESEVPFYKNRVITSRYPTFYNFKATFCTFIILLLLLLLILIITGKPFSGLFCQAAAQVLSAAAEMRAWTIDNIISNIWQMISLDWLHFILTFPFGKYVNITIPQSTTTNIHNP